MSRRTSIIKALFEKLKAIDGIQYPSNIFNNAHPRLVYWDSCSDFPSIYGTPGSESRTYMPGNLTWCHLGISLKVYCKGESSQEQLEVLLEDIENVINANRVLIYDTTNGYTTTEILITSIVTDEGLLAPFSIGEINLAIQYQYPQI